MELRIRELRQQLGITVKQMSEQTGIHRRNLETYHQGTTPSIQTIEKIAKAYNVNPAWLVGWSDNLDVVEEPVYIEVDKGRLPPYWNNDNGGKLISWK
ncbi:helix-turn-helix domain-containing protein [Streptococcus sp. sy010]|uniref:helix-turn-helix domain-containing protein n=1 Tax=Streptococcus sp. sy010 TaxID=2600148 RepID=UPI0011B83FAD|nr:helix-turn-helix transcriptional regulator [Streptococcus sp. sy010]TWT16440.1 helix-turn-helix transcriptional regulator [Streptococcus sp. sy010]